ncbi:rhoGAP domain-containing protein [Ditylenchus destructor]|nr:rhoGAP domain-containing protein [Ditylenchus destructor]
MDICVGGVRGSTARQRLPPTGPINSARGASAPLLYPTNQNRLHFRVTLFYLPTLPVKLKLGPGCVKTQRRKFIQAEEQSESGSCESEKNEWFAKLSECIRRRFRPRTTTIGVSVRIEGRQQYIRQEVQNGRRASEIVQELIDTLDLPALDPHLHHYELCFETGKDVPANAHQPTSASGTVSGVPSAVATTASTGGLFHSGCTIRPLNGVENVYSILMDHVASAGLTLSDSQLAQLDTCPMTHCRLVLRQSSTSGGSSSRSNAALNFVNQFRKVLSRTESSSKRLFGRQLEGSMPPQPVLTMIDHLTMHAADIEGIFRKSPKQATVRVLKTQLDHGQVPDFHQFNVHVTASLLKEYLRSIPGQLLISGNYHLWMEMCDEVDPVKKLRICRNLLRLLPASHTVLLRSVVRLLRRIAANEETSKMSARSLAVCIAPSLLENPNIVDSARKVPELAVYLIEHATEIFDGFVEEGALLVVPKQTDQQQQDESEAARRLHQSTDSGLSDDAGTCGKQSAGSQNSKTALLGVSTTFSSSADPLPTAKSVSPDSALFESIGPMSDCSGDDESNKGNSRGDAVSKKPTQLSRESGVRIEEIESNENKALSRQNATADDESSADEDDGPTPTAVLSRENSDVKTQFPNRYQWKSHISTDPTTPLAQSNRSQPKTVYKGLTESDLVKSPSEVRILRLKPQSASPAASPSLSMASVNSERFRRLGAQGSSFVSNLDELRVSDYIISHKKIESTDSAKTLTLDFNTTPNKSRPSSASERNPSRKTSTNSNFSAVSETSNASERQHGALRRVNLLSKNESLGLSSDSRNRSTNISTPGSQTRPNSSSGTRNGGPLSSRQANNGSSQIARTPSNGNARSSSANLKRNNSINTSQVGTGLKSSRENLVQKVVQAPLSTGFASTTSTRFGTLDRKSASGNTTPGLVQQTGTIIRRENQTASKPTVTSNSSTPIARSYNSSGRGGSLKSPTASSENPYTAISKTNSANSNTQQKSSHTAPTTVSLARRSQVGPMRSNGGLVTKCSNGESPSHGGSRRTTGANSTLDRSASIPSKSTAWRPPKRTAEDIVLDKLEVNWSVPSIRSVFQQNKDVKPASIDTVYAKLPSSASAAGNQPAANNENLHKVPASQSVFGH